MSESVKFRESVLYTLSFVFLLWGVKYLEHATSADFSSLGILPRTMKGSLGIITSPLVHGDFFHLFSNTFPLIFTGIGTLYFYRRDSLVVFIAVYLVTGLLVWMFARNAYHLGASGIVYGLVSYLFFSGVFRKELPSISISLIVVFLYSGMVYQLFPGDEKISWETHSLGALVGLFCAYYFYKSRKIRQQKDDEDDSEVEAREKYQPTINYTLTDKTFTYTFKSKDEEN